MISLSQRRLKCIVRQLVIGLSSSSWFFLNSQNYSFNLGGLFGCWRSLVWSLAFKMLPTKKREAINLASIAFTYSTTPLNMILVWPRCSDRRSSRSIVGNPHPGSREPGWPVLYGIGLRVGRARSKRIERGSRWILKTVTHAKAAGADQAQCFRLWHPYSTGWPSPFMFLLS